MSGNAHLTNVEAQRIMAVLDELAVDLRLVFSVTPQVRTSGPPPSAF